MKKEDIRVLIFAALLVLFESVVYFLCKLSPLKLTVLGSSFDDKLPFIPFFACFYYLWYVYLFLIPLILNRVNKKYFFKYASTTVICILLGALIFILYPTTINRGVELNNYKSIFTYIVKFIYMTDNPNLCCLPSMHCALSFIFIYSTFKAKELKGSYKILIAITSLAIIASTLFIKQHVIWDVIAAFIVVTISIIIDKFVNLDKFIEKIFEKIKIGNKIN